MFWEPSRYYVARSPLPRARKPTPSTSTTPVTVSRSAAPCLATTTATAHRTITGITGTYNGIAIAGIVPLGADSSYLYNNLLYYPADPLFVDNDGILFNVPGVGDVNLYYDPGFGYGNITGSLDSGFVTTAVTLDCSPAPEPATLGLLGIGILATLAVVRRRTSHLARVPHS